MRPFALIALVATAAAATEMDALNAALQHYNGGDLERAAAGFQQVEEKGAVEANRWKAQVYLADSLEKLGLPFGAFFYYARGVEAGAKNPFFARSAEGAVRAAAQLGDEVVAPNVFAKAYGEHFKALPPDVRAQIDSQVALLDYRAGKLDEAEALLSSVPPSSPAYARAEYLRGLILSRKDPEKAVQTFRALLGIARGDLRELSQLALGRTLYGLRRYAEASHAYAQLPRFSRHWDEALFEGAYADLQNDDPGAALGKLHSLHSPHLRDEFAPESINLTAVIYHQRCLYPQVREALAAFDAQYLPIKERLKKLLAENPAPEAYVQMLAADDTRLPTAVQHHLQKNERVQSMLSYRGRLEVEAAKVKANVELGRNGLAADLLDLIARQRALVEKAAGTFIQGRIADMERLIEALDGDKEIIGFETTKGEKEALESNLDLAAQLRTQALYRPAMPKSGHEYWPFDGEYWPDEIGYYTYTLKDACPKKKDSP